MEMGFDRSVFKTTCLAPACSDQLAAAAVTVLPYPCRR